MVVFSVLSGTRVWSYFVRMGELLFWSYKLKCVILLA